MALTPGTRLGPYEILALIGAGGMGEVYRALDPRMGREVAIKVSAERFSDRFSREVHAVAALNHPNICHLYDVGPDYLVMELVEGHPPKGPLPVETALNYARQIADALEAAHEKGIVHRDLKPANIKITPEGTVKVLDFGLAKLAEPPVSGTSPDHSPTLTLEHATSAGIILGTAGYMPPEQARGKRVDKRADIWAFGVVFYEMLTGEQPFEGETVSDTLAAVLEREPHWERVPAKVRRLLQSCLEKDPRKRLRDIGDVWRLLDEAPAPQAKHVSWIPWIAAAALAVALGAALWAPWRAAPPAAEVMRFQIPLPEKTDVANAAFAVSPDGRWLAFLVRGPDGLYRHWVRALDSLEARELPGSQSIYDTPFFWSPDSQFIAYDAGGKLKKIAAVGGPAQTLCDLPGLAVGGSWNRDGVILVGTIGGGVLRVSAAGGTPSPVTQLDSSHKGVGNVFPAFLPDGRHFLYFSGPAGSGGQVFFGSLDVKPAEQNTKPLLTGSNVIAASVLSADAGSTSGIGRLLFVREKTLLAQGFDIRHLELAGDAVPVAERVDNFSVSENGVLVYRTGVGQVSQLTWLDRQGKTLGTVGDIGVYNDVVLSPDATRAVVSRVGDNGQDLWLMDLAHGGSIRFTFAAGVANIGVWSPDGARIAFSSLKSGGADLYQKPVGGTKDEELLLKSNDFKIPTSWSRDGRFLLYNVLGFKTKGDVWVLPLESRKPVQLLGTEFEEADGQFSPDGKWIAYQSDESGHNEVYVRPFLADSAGGAPSVGPRSLISKGGGTTPFWREEGRELFYVSPDRTLMAVAVSSNQVLPFGEPKALFKRLEAITGDVAGDGKRILAALPAAQSTPAPFTVVLNWQAALKK